MPVITIDMMDPDGSYRAAVLSLIDAATARFEPEPPPLLSRIVARLRGAWKRRPGGVPRQK